MSVICVYLKFTFSCANSPIQLVFYRSQLFATVLCVCQDYKWDPCCVHTWLIIPNDLPGKGAFTPATVSLYTLVRSGEIVVYSKWHIYTTFINIALWRWTKPRKQMQFCYSSKLHLRTKQTSYKYENKSFCFWEKNQENKHTSVDTDL